MHKKVFFEHIIYLISKLKKGEEIRDYYAGSINIFFMSCAQKIISPLIKSFF